MGQDEDQQTVFGHPVEMYSPVDGERFSVIKVRGVYVIAAGPVSVVTPDDVKPGSLLAQLIDRTLHTSRRGPAVRRSGSEMESLSERMRQAVKEVE